MSTARGARERILRTASELFYRQGINATGVEQLAAAAHVSKRTLYQHFASKDDLIAAYVRGQSHEGPTAVSRLAQPGRSPRESLLAIFDVMGVGRVPTGCPYLKTAAELADRQHPARVLAARSKREFIDALADLARQAGARDPVELGFQLALLFDGAQSQGVTVHSSEPVMRARMLAATLIDAATKRPPHRAPPPSPASSA